MNKSRLHYLYTQDRHRISTLEEFDEFKKALSTPLGYAILNESIQDELDKSLNLYDVNNEKFDGRLAEILYYPKRNKPQINYWNKFAAIAIISLGIGAGAYISVNTDQTDMGSNYIINDITPGKNGATLTLNNGRKFDLSSLKNGPNVIEEGLRITKLKDGQLEYSITDKKHNKSTGYNTLSTSNGQQVLVRLADSTLIWLNAASTLKYPASFAAFKERRIELSGEAYFEVTKDKHHPFIVQTGHYEVKVLGTHFNIMDYPSDMLSNTTLVEGAVQISHNGTKILLKPGQQMYAINSGPAVITAVNAEETIAWKNGYFIFNEDLKLIMDKISRWYDVQIVYESGLNPALSFQGKIARNRNLSEVLQMLAYTGNIQFEIKGRRVIVKN